jgi:hypothetical protein
MQRTLLLSRKMLFLFLFILGMSASSQTIAQLSIAGITGSTCVFPTNTPGVLKTGGASGGTGNYQYFWESKPSSSVSWSSLPSTDSRSYQPPVLTQSYDFRVGVLDLSNPTGIPPYFYDVAISSPLTITYLSAPLNPGSITVDITEVCVGSSPGLIYNVASASNAGEGLYYQWQLSTDGGNNWANISGATGSGYTPTSITQTTMYRRAANDQCGSASRTAYSSPVTISNFAPLSGGSINHVLQYALVGAVPPSIGNVATASGGSTKYTYRWQISTDGTNWADIVPAENNITLQPAALLSPGLYHYRRMTTDNICLNEISSNVSRIRVFYPLTGGAALTNFGCAFSGDYTVINGSSAYGGGVPFATAPFYLFQWQKKGASDANYIDIVGATSLHLGSYGPLTESTNFRRKIIDALGNVAYSEIATINIINSTLLPGSIAVRNAITCYNSSPAPIVSTASASGFATGVQYGWESRPASSVIWTVIPGEVRGSLVNTGVITEKTYYRRSVSDGCGGGSTRTVYTDEVFVDVLPDLVAGSFNSPQYAPIGNTFTLNQNTATSGGSGIYTYQWQSGSSLSGPWSDIAGETNASYTTPVIGLAISYYRRIDIDVNCSTQKPTSSIQLIPGDPLNGGQIYTITGCVYPGYVPEQVFFVTNASGGLQPYSYSWERKPNSTNLWQSIPSQSGVDYQPPMQTETVMYRRVVTDGFSLSANSNEVGIRLQSGPVDPGTIGFETPLVGFVCGNVTIQVSNVTSASNFGNYARYQWQTSTDGANWVDVAGATRGTKASITVNTATFVRRKFIDGCSGVYREHLSNVLYIPGYPALSGGCIGYGTSSIVICNPAITPISTYSIGFDPEIFTNVTSPTGGSGSFSIQWQYTVDFVNWIDIAGGNGTTYNSGVLTDPHMFIAFRRKVTDATCNQVAYSGIAAFFNFTYPFGRSSMPTTLIEAIKKSTPKELTVTNKIAVYPNPASGGQEITVLINEKSNSKFQATLKAMDGRNINCVITNTAEGQLKVRLPLPIAPGTYVLQIVSGTKQWTEKIMVR